MRFTSGLPETCCGLGSTLKTTENLRAIFPALLAKCGIKSLIDAPCGDANWISHTDLCGIDYLGIDFSAENLRACFPALLAKCGTKSLIDAPCGDANWISHTDLCGIDYLGIDFSAENLQTAIEKEWAEHLRPEVCAFKHADVLKMTFPDADAILCRDFFQHIPTSSVEEFLEDIENDGLGWLLATSFDNERNDEIGPEMFRPLNLRIAPFDLDDPEFEISDPPGSGRILGAWPL